MKLYNPIKREKTSYSRTNGYAILRAYETWSTRNYIIRAIRHQAFVSLTTQEQRRAAGLFFFEKGDPLQILVFAKYSIWPVQTAAGANKKFVMIRLDIFT